MAKNAIKALVKGVIAVLILIAISRLTAPFTAVLPEYNLAFNVFALVFVLFMVIGQLFADTIFKHILDVFSALFLIGYLLYTFTTNVLVINVENVTFIIDLQVILSIIMLLSLVGFAKALLGLVNYMVENVNSEKIKA
jgi:hypothetical protein